MSNPTYKGVVKAEPEVGQKEVEIDLLVHPRPVRELSVEVPLAKWVQMPPA